MKKTIQLALASTAALALAACGSSTDASEEAMADTVEMPADDAMDGTPDPVADDEAMMDNTEMDAMEAADAAEDLLAADAGDMAEGAADEAAETVTAE